MRGLWPAACDLVNMRGGEGHVVDTDFNGTILIVLSIKQVPELTATVLG